MTGISPLNVEPQGSRVGDVQPLSETPGAECQHPGKEAWTTNLVTKLFVSSSVGLISNYIIHPRQAGFWRTKLTESPM